MSTSCHTQTGGSLHKGRVIPNYRISLNPNKLNKAAIASGRPSSRQFCIKPPIVLDNPTRNPYVSGSGKMIRFCKLIPVFCNNSTRAPYPKVEKVEGGTASAALVGAEGARPSPPPPASHPPPCVCCLHSQAPELSCARRPAAAVGSRWVQQVGAHNLQHGPVDACLLAGAGLRMSPHMNVTNHC